MVSSRHHRDADNDADKKTGFKRLFLGFMAKELLAYNGAWPAARHAEDQQRGFRDPAHPFTRCHLIRAIHGHRQHIDQQKPDNQWIRGQQTADGSENQE